MIDLYAFPKQGNTVYDADVIKLKTGKEKAILLQKKIKDPQGYRNFILYVQLHEYEALLLSRPDALAEFYTLYSRNCLSGMVRYSRKIIRPAFLCRVKDLLLLPLARLAFPRLQSTRIRHSIASRLVIHWFQDKCPNRHLS